MKKILIIASLALCCSLLASCEDFLDTKKYGAKTDWETQEDVEKALVALFSFNTNDAEGVTGRGITWFECCSDDMTVGRPQGEAEDIRNFRMSPSNGRDVKNNWKIMYEVNAKANNIIKVVPTMNLDNAFKTKATGTAYFFRGFAMLWLSPYYGDNGPNGGIPIILDTTEPAAMDSPRPASVLQNYDQIISDLREAGERLPLFSQLAPQEYGMPHKAAAWAFAARAALYAAQFDAKYYDTVIEMCDKVRDLPAPTSASCSTTARTRPSQTSGASSRISAANISSRCWAARSTARNSTACPSRTAAGVCITTGVISSPPFPCGTHSNRATPAATRRSSTPGRRSASWAGTSYSAAAPIRSPRIRACRSANSSPRGKRPTAKAREVNSNGDNASNTLGTCLIRFADVLLMKAEALIWKNGEGDAEAKQLLNRIRKRARLPENSPATKAELKNQRRCELAFEFMPSRHLDMVRWGDAKEAYAKPTQRVNSHWDYDLQQVVIDAPSNYDNGRTFDPVINQVFPIPVTAFNGTVNLTQNQGY